MTDPKPAETPAERVDLIDTVKTPDPDSDAGRLVEEIGEPFEGNNA